MMGKSLIAIAVVLVAILYGVGSGVVMSRLTRGGYDETTVDGKEAIAIDDNQMGGNYVATVEHRRLSAWE